jgi:lipoprotein NlpD
MKYVVKSGDNLSSIGSKLHVSWSSIASANGIKPPYRIYPGQSLEIPGGGTSGPVAGPPSYSGQPITPYNPSSSNSSSSSSSGSAANTLPAAVSEPMQLFVNGAILYGIFRVLMRVF